MTDPFTHRWWFYKCGDLIVSDRYRSETAAREDAPNIGMGMRASDGSIRINPRYRLVNEPMDEEYR